MIKFSLIFSILLSAGFGLSQNFQKVEAYAFERQGIKGEEDGDKWLIIYLYDGKPYFTYNTNSDLESGSCYEFEIDKNKPTNFIETRLLDEKVQNTIVFYGHDFLKGDVFMVYQNEIFIKSIELEDSFGFKVSMEKNTNLKLIRAGHIYSEYDFNFQIPSVINFHTFEMMPPVSKVSKKAVFNSGGDCEVLSKPIND